MRGGENFFFSITPRPIDPHAGLAVCPLVFYVCRPFFSHIAIFVCCWDTCKYCLSICTILCDAWQRFAMYPGTGLIWVYSCSYPWSVTLVFPQDESRMLADHIEVVSVVCCRPSDKHGRASAADFLPTLLRCLLYQLVLALLHCFWSGPTWFWE